MKNCIYVFYVFFFFGSIVNGQTYEDAYRKGINYKETYRNEEGLAIFQVLMKHDSSNADYLANGSVLYSRAAFRQPMESKKTEYYKTAQYLAKKAIGLNKSNAEAHYAYALALGRLNEHAGSKQKIASAKLIKDELETAIKIDPDHAGAYHILGRWHRTIAGFNYMEKLAINALFGGVPEGGSYDAAIDAFKKAIRIQPEYILHYYELALTYSERNSANDKQEAKKNIQAALSLPNLAPEDPSTKLKCAELLKKL